MAHGPSGVEFSERSVPVANGGLPCFECGSGPVVVHLQGLPGVEISRLDELLSGHFRVVVLDVLAAGAGGETSTSGLDAILSGIVPPGGDYGLIGSSFAAGAALSRALVSPHEVSALVLLGPVLGPPLESGAALDREELRARLLKHPERWSSKGAANLEPRSLERLWSGPIGADLEAGLSGLTVPTLALFGADDQLISPETGRELRRQLPSCNLAFVYDAGHAIELERPEACTEAVADFLERREAFAISNRTSLLSP
jgi:pimeloyl-ACP methyl ester carboxylesterase